MVRKIALEEHFLDPPPNPIGARQWSMSRRPRLRNSMRASPISANGD